MTTKLVSYHANPSYHIGHEEENICVAFVLLISRHCLEDDPKKVQDYAAYLKLCQTNGVSPYNEEVWNDHVAGKAYKA